LASFKFRSTHWICLVTLVIPTVLAVIYFGLVASDVYISESRFVVRSPQRAASQTGLGALLATGGFSRSQDDTLSVHDFVLSRDALMQLDRELNIRSMFSQPSIDVTSRYGTFDWSKSFESLYLYYQKHVDVDYDTASSISTLTVRAYSAKDAHAINELLLHMSEQLVNNLNERSRQDLIQVAQKEVQLAEAKAKTAALALSAYRANRSVFDPVAQGALQLQSMSKMQEDLFATEAQIAQLRKTAPDNPQIPALVSYANLLRQGIASESEKVVGGSASLVAKAPVFDRLSLESGFADKQLAAAMAALEEARGEANRKQLYLERLVQPNVPDEAMEPRRIRSVLMVFLLGLVVWGVVSLVVASVKEHTD